MLHIRLYSEEIVDYLIKFVVDLIVALHRRRRPRKDGSLGVDRGESVAMLLMLDIRTLDYSGSLDSWNIPFYPRLWIS